jgi:hypothetical protein
MVPLWSLVTSLAIASPSPAPTQSRRKRNPDPAGDPPSGYSSAIARLDFFSLEAAFFALFSIFLTAGLDSVLDLGQPGKDTVRANVASPVRRYEISFFTVI